MRREYKTLKQQYLRCRTFNHEWDDVSGLPEFEYSPRVQWLRGWRITLRCTICTTIRREVWSTITGQIMSRSYTYPEGYSVLTYEGEGTIKEAFRREFMARRKSQEKKVNAK